MGVKVRYVEERWVKRNGTAEKEKLETPYWAVFVDYKGQRKFIKVEGGKRKAEKKAEEIEKGLVRDELTNPEDDPGAELFEEYAERWLQRKKAMRKNATFLSYKTTLDLHVLPVFGKVPLRDIRRADVKNFITAKIQEGYAPGTVSTFVSALRAALGEVVDDDETLDVNVAARPGKHLPKPKKKKPSVYGFDARDLIEDTVRKEAPDFLPAIMLGFRAGLRIGEICALSWDDVDFDAKKITVRHTYSRGGIGSPKGGRERELRLPPELETVLVAYRTRTAERNLKLGTRWIYPALMGKNAGKKKFPVSDDWLRCRFSKYLKKAGFEPSGNTHRMRHSFGSHLFAVGASTPMVRDLMGHVDLATTNIYAHTVDDAMEVMGRLERAGKPASPRKQRDLAEGERQ